MTINKRTSGVLFRFKNDDESNFLVYNLDHWNTIKNQTQQQPILILPPNLQTTQSQDEKEVKKNGYESIKNHLLY